MKLASRLDLKMPATIDWRRIGLTYALGALGGLVAHMVGLPLAWMLGPFFLCGVISATGFSLATLPFGRELGQMMVGLSIGLRFTSATLLATLSLVPAMLGSTIYVMAYTMIAAFLFRPIAGANPTTSFFATAAGGMADMAIVAGKRGGDPAAVGIVHAIRVSTTVATVPLLVIAFGTIGTNAVPAAATSQGLFWLALAFLLALPAVRLLRGTPIPNPWLVAPMLVGVALSTTDLMSVQMPIELIMLAQLLLGTWLGCQFKREVMARLPRAAFGGALVTLFMIGAAYAGALVLSAATGLSVSTAFLALAPAAMTEMVLTAKAMRLDVELVTAFHVVRIFLVCSTILLVFRVYKAIREAFGPSD
jgi:membrane AbrB-like protein